MTSIPTEQESLLLTTLIGEEENAVNYAQQGLAQAQIDGLKRYNADPYGDEIEGRSKITTHELQETVEWLRPEFGRMFAGGDRCVEFEGTTAESDQYAEQAADYVNYVFMHDNEGEKILDEFAFDGLVQRMGVIASEWKEAEYERWQPATGLNSQQIQQLMDDPSVEVKDIKVGGDDDDDVQLPDVAHPDGIFVSCKIRSRTEEAKAEVFTIAPEDFRVSARAVDLDTAPYCGDVMRILRGDALEKWPDHKEAINAYSGRTVTSQQDQRRAERFRDLLTSADLPERSSHDEADEIEIFREFIRFDFDQDGYPEMLRCYRLGTQLLEHEEVDEHIYSYWTPIPIPHRLVGLSISDITVDLQRAKTVLLRGMLDSAYQAIVPRTVANRQNVNLDALLNLTPGVVIDCDGNPADQVMPIVTPDLTPAALGAMQWIDQIAEARTGVSRHGQGLDPDVLNKMVVKGVQFLQNADSLRKEQYARNFAIGLKHFFAKLYRLVCKHQNEARTVKIAGNFRSVDPRTFGPMRCTVSTGLGTGAKEAHLGMLQMIQQDQMLAYQTFGPSPMVGLEQLYHTVQQKLRVMGYKSPDAFFGRPVNPDGTPYVPQPQPSPEMAKVQAQSQADQAKLQSDVQFKQLTIQADVAERQGKMQLEHQQGEQDLQLQREKAKAELDLAREKAQAEMVLAQQRMENEMKIAWAEMQLNAEIKREEIAMKERVGKAQAESSEGDDLPKNRPGGSLAA